MANSIKQISQFYIDIIQYNISSISATINNANDSIADMYKNCIQDMELTILLPSISEPFIADNLIKLSLPNCSYICNSAFYECKYLSYAELDLSKITYIGDNALKFSDLTNYNMSTYLDLPNCSYIGSNTFMYCQNLSSISIPNCSYIGNNAFNNCWTLSYAELDLSKITYIGDNALSFVSLTNYNTSTYLELPNCRYAAQAFATCSILSSISLPNCTSLASYAFQYCRGMTSISPMPNCSYIGSYAFYGCSKLTNSCVQEILDNYKSYSTAINVGVFFMCSSITNLDLTGYTSIGGSAFADCKSLTSISLPNCSYISGSAFSGCMHLIYVRIYLLYLYLIVVL